MQDPAPHPRCPPQTLSPLSPAAPAFPGCILGLGASPVELSSCVPLPRGANALLSKSSSSSSSPGHAASARSQGAPSGFVPSYRRGATPRLCQGQRIPKAGSGRDTQHHRFLHLWDKDPPPGLGAAIPPTLGGLRASPRAPVAGAGCGHRWLLLAAGTVPMSPSVPRGPGWALASRGSQPWPRRKALCKRSGVIAAAGLSPRLG